MGLGPARTAGPHGPLSWWSRDGLWLAIARSGLEAGGIRVGNDSASEGKSPFKLEQSNGVKPMHGRDSF